MTQPQTITAIVPNPRNPARSLVKVGKRTAASLPERAIKELRLEIGVEWTPELAARVVEAAGFDKAMRGAIRRLDRRALSRKRLGEEMREAGVDAAMTARVVERLTKIGALDDEALGRVLIEEIQSRKPAGPALLRAKLRQRGLDGVLVDRLVQETVESSGADPIADATALARKRLRSLERFAPVVKKRRLWGLLARRGFDRDTIERALSSLPELRDSVEDF